MATSARDPKTSDSPIPIQPHPLPQTDAKTAEKTMERKMTTVCVTGAGGFVASWLVERLLAAGRYTVHGTVRDPGDAKNAHLAALDGAAERLRLFKADLLDYGSMAAAIAGCDGVFHVACPVHATAVADPEAALPFLGFAIRHAHAFNWYCLSKTLAELEAFNYAKRSGLDVVTVCPSLVIGPLLQSTLNASSSVIVDCLKGEHEVKMKLRNFVDVRDVADGLLLVYETPEASGRYICNSRPRQVSEVIKLLKSWYPTYKFADKFVQVSDEPVFSSKKLETLGWQFKSFEETLRDSVESYRVKGVLD
ncbi:hypothetical protein EJB05_41605, partial [Eragrostis curvula]